MANEIRVRGNFISGTLSGALTNVATSMSSAGLANLGVIDATNYAAITIENEIVWVTAHTGGATTATIVRGQEGTTGAAHSSAVAWQHGPTAYDVDSVANPASCRAKRTTSQSITNSTPTAVQFDAADDWDTATLHDTVTLNTRVVLKALGLWVIEAGVMFASNATGSRDVWIQLNGATRLDEDGRSANATDVTVLSLSTKWKAAAITDYVELVVFQTSGGALNVLGTPLAAYLSATRVGTGA